MSKSTFDMQWILSSTFEALVQSDKNETKNSLKRQKRLIEKRPMSNLFKNVWKKKVTGFFIFHERCIACGFFCQGMGKKLLWVVNKNETARPWVLVCGKLSRMFHFCFRRLHNLPSGADVEEISAETTGDEGQVTRRHHIFSGGRRHCLHLVSNPQSQQIHLWSNKCSSRVRFRLLYIFLLCHQCCNAEFSYQFCNSGFVRKAFQSEGEGSAVLLES